MLLLLKRMRPNTIFREHNNYYYYKGFYFVVCVEGMHDYHQRHATNWKWLMLRLHSALGDNFPWTNMQVVELFYSHVVSPLLLIFLLLLLHLLLLYFDCILLLHIFYIVIHISYQYHQICINWIQYNIDVYVKICDILYCQLPFANTTGE